MSYYSRPRPRIELGQGEVFSLLDELDRMIKWWEANRPNDLPQLTMPRRWKKKDVLRELLPKFATWNDAEGIYYYRDIPLKFPPEL